VLRTPGVEVVNGVTVKRVLSEDIRQVRLVLINASPVLPVTTALDPLRPLTPLYLHPLLRVTTLP
jgi:hypothetical protein